MLCSWREASDATCVEIRERIIYRSTNLQGAAASATLNREYTKSRKETANGRNIHLSVSLLYPRIDYKRLMQFSSDFDNRAEFDLISKN